MNELSVAFELRRFELGQRVDDWRAGVLEAGEEVAGAVSCRSRRRLMA